MNELIKDKLWKSIEQNDYLDTFFPLWDFVEPRYFTGEDHNIRCDHYNLFPETKLPVIDNTFYMLVLCAEGEEIC